MTPRKPLFWKYWDVDAMSETKPFDLHLLIFRRATGRCHRVTFSSNIDVASAWAAVDVAARIVGVRT